MEESLVVSMADIARKAGVSQSTVSLALRGSPKISESTRLRIQDLAASMGYCPNPLVTALMQSRKGRSSHKGLLTIAFISFEDLSNTLKEEKIYRDFEEGAAEEVAKHGFQIQKFKVSKELSVSRINQILLARGIRGVMISSLPEQQDALQLSWEEFSSIAIGPTLRRPQLHRVISDHYDNMRLLLKHVEKQGYRRIGFCLSKSSDDRTDGRWEACFLHHFHEMDGGLVLPVLKLNKGAPSRVLFDWIDANQPEIIICVRAKRILNWLEDAGYSVPDDIALATVAAALPTARISGIFEDGFTVGARAVAQLIRMVQMNETGVPQLPMKIMLPGAIHSGETMRSVFSGD
jgi:LacI family transcriptional regulator